MPLSFLLRDVSTILPVQVDVPEAMDDTAPVAAWRDGWVRAAALVVLAVALAYGFFAHPLFNPDDYVRWAQHFGRWWQTAQDQFVMRTPGYPLFLAMCFALGGHGPVIVLQSLALAGACLLTAQMTGTAVGIVPARAAAWAFACYLPLLSYAGTAMTEVLATTLLVVAVYAVIRVRRAQRLRGAMLKWGAIGTVAIALATIIHPNAVMYAAVVALALVWLAWRAAGLRRALAMAGVVVACVAVVFGPWVTRNLAATGKPMPFGDNGTYPLALGLHLPWDTTSGRYGSFNRSNNFFGGRRADGFSTQQARQAKPLQELKDNLEHHTGELIESRVLMTYNMWAWPATPRIQNAQPEVIPYGLLRGFHLFVVVAGVMGLVLMRRRLFGLMGLALTTVTFLVHLVYWSNPRYVIPLAPFLLAGSGMTIATLWAWLRQTWRDRRRPPHRRRVGLKRVGEREPALRPAAGESANG